MNRALRVAAIAAAVGMLASAQDARQIVQESQKRGRSKSEHYEGSLEVVNVSKKITSKRWQYDRLGAYGESRTVLRFTAPPEVKGVALLVINHPDRASDQWMWIPAEERDRRVALQDRSQRFFGTDFSFEDMEERDVDQYDYKLAAEETIDGAPAWKIEARPRQARSSQYTVSYLWIRKDNYVIARADNFRNEKLVRRITYEDVAVIDGIATPRTVQVFDSARNSRTILKLEKLQYNLSLRSEAFSREALRR